MAELPAPCTSSRLCMVVAFLHQFLVLTINTAKPHDYGASQCNCYCYFRSNSRKPCRQECLVKLWRVHGVTCSIIPNRGKCVSITPEPFYKPDEAFRIPHLRSDDLKIDSDCGTIKAMLTYFRINFTFCFISITYDAKKNPF